MRILISIWSLQVGGGEILALNLAAGLAARGHTVFIFNQRAHLVDKKLVQRLIPTSIQVLSMADRPARSFIAYKLDAVWQRLGLEAAYYEQAQQAYMAWCLQHYQIELVHSHATYSDRLCLPVVRTSGIPLVITEHGEYTQYTREGRRDFLPILQGAQAIVAVSDYCHQTMAAGLPGLPRLKTIYNGVVLQYDANAGSIMRQQLGLAADAFVIGMAARGRPDKGWHIAVEAFRQLRVDKTDRPIHLVLIGGSEYLSELQQACADEPDIIFTGQVANPGFYIAGLDVGLLPTYFAAEALPLVIIEYMTCGKPTISTRLGGIPELLQQKQGVTGQLLEVDAATGKPDSLALAVAIRRYRDNPTLYIAHSQQAQEIAQRTFTMSACVRNYEQLYNDLLAPSPLP
jgi:glycosyltransferase involved in cell wall biosynthesis